MLVSSRHDTCQRAESDIKWIPCPLSDVDIRTGAMGRRRTGGRAQGCWCLVPIVMRIAKAGGGVSSQVTPRQTRCRGHFCLIRQVNLDLGQFRARETGVTEDHDRGDIARRPRWCREGTWHRRGGGNYSPTRGERPGLPHHALS